MRPLGSQRIRCHTTQVIQAQSASSWALDILLGIAVVAVVSIGVGATAPRWPTRWLTQDRGPLRLLLGSDPQRYRRLGAKRLKRFFPELGTVFGGVSKNVPPDFADAASVRAYIVEIRRAEWVHWLSVLGWLPLPFFQPWPLALAFLLVIVVVNGAAEVILRYNKLRLYQLLDILGSPRIGEDPSGDE